MELYEILVAQAISTILLAIKNPRRAAKLRAPLKKLRNVLVTLDLGD